MTLSPRVRRAALTAHVTTSVGWVGAVITFIAIAVVGLTAGDGATVRGAYLIMDAAARSGTMLDGDLVLLGSGKRGVRVFMLSPSGKMSGV